MFLDTGRECSIDRITRYHTQSGPGNSGVEVYATGAVCTGRDTAASDLHSVAGTSWLATPPFTRCRGNKVLWVRSDLRLAEFEAIPSTPHRSTETELEELSGWGNQERVFLPRQRHFIFFRDIDTTVIEMPTFGDAMGVLNDALRAMQVAYLAGWAYRGIGSENIIAHQAPGEGQYVWQVKLCDIEYAKRYKTSDNASSRDLKMGVPYFMAHEVLKSKPLLPEIPVASIEEHAGANPESIHSEESGSYLAGSDADRILEKMEAFFASVGREESEESNDEKADSIVYNFQHDIESIWWLTLHTATARIDHKPSQRFASKIFQNRTEVWEDREDCFLRPIVNTLKRCLHPEIKKMRLADILERLRSHILMQYRKITGARLANDATTVIKHLAVTHQLFYFAFRALVKETRKCSSVPLAIQEANREVTPQRRNLI